MVLNPDVQSKAQDEITRVCDPNQLPSLDDIDSLPYVTAVVLEVLRWSASAPLGAPTDSP
jgi:cytochrome P450